MDFVLHGTIGTIITTYPLYFLANLLGWTNPIVGFLLVAIATIVFIIGAFPDIIGFIGTTTYGSWKLYLDAHQGVGFFKYMKYIPAYWLHVTLDKFTHRKEGGWKWWAYPVDVALWALVIYIIYLWIF